MKRWIMPAGIALAAATPSAAVAAVTLDSPGPKPPSAAHVRAYLHAYKQVARQLGRRAPGRNIITGAAGHRALTDAKVLSSLHVLEQMLAGPQTPSTSNPVPASVATAGAAGVPACASESGTNYSTGPSNTNASSGATGRYQITPSTAAAYGCSLSTPAGQDACAQTIYANQGAGAWVGCGG